MEEFTFQGFKVVELQCSKDGTFSSHSILMKQHDIRDFDIKKPSGFTLFIINIPPYITEENIKTIMSEHGKIVDVFLHREPDSKAPPPIIYPIFEPSPVIYGFKVGYVVFSQRESVEKVMAIPSDQPLILNPTKLKTGLLSWYNEYNKSIMSVESIGKEADRIIADYDLRKEREKELSSKEPDDEGWVTVNANVKRKKVTIATRKQLLKKTKRKKKELVNFYEFQKKSAKMEHLEQHMKMYEQDRNRLQAMKEARKFRPL